MSKMSKEEKLLAKLQACRTHGVEVKRYPNIDVSVLGHSIEAGEGWLTVQIGHTAVTPFQTKVNVKDVVIKGKR